ncbi:MAG TPA: DNA-processing protein DprA, partial [Gammaproteobacteria bacterium]|nr:DNA-processing protein DprA [Gammaproteobacteria bacterium]
NPSSGGCDTARNFASHLARAGLVISSGMASGIDTAAHQGALHVSGATIAVCGTGLDRVYPASNRDLARQISENGALVSEFPPGTPPLAQNFPSRNRILSGLAVGTLVVEAAVRSGSLITARLATDQGREVFAIPGSIHNPLSRGCHRLIRDGAKLVETADDILQELAPLLETMAQEPAINPDRTAKSPNTHTDEEDPDYTALLKVVGYDPTPVDVIVQRSGLPAGVVSSMLLILELQNRVHALPGGRYVCGQ